MHTYRHHCTTIRSQFGSNGIYYIHSSFSSCKLPKLSDERTVVNFLTVSKLWFFFWKVCSFHAVQIESKFATNSQLATRSCQPASFFSLFPLLRIVLDPLRLHKSSFSREVSDQIRDLFAGLIFRPWFSDGATFRGRQKMHLFFCQ